MRRPPYIPGIRTLASEQAPTAFEKAPKGAINLGLGQPRGGYGPLLPAITAARRIVRDKPMGYTLNAGYPDAAGKTGCRICTQRE